MITATVHGQQPQRAGGALCWLDSGVWSRVYHAGMDKTPDSRMRIGTLAKAASVPIDTIRYYERRGLMPEPRRAASGYRSYGADSLQRLQFIRRAKALGFGLTDIQCLLDLSADGSEGVAGVKARAMAQLAGIEARMMELSRMKSALQALIEACPGHGELATCPILAALGEQPDSGEPR